MERMLVESRPEQHQVGRNHAAIALADDEHANITVQKKGRVKEWKA